MEHMDIIKFNSWAKTHILDENRFDDNGNINLKKYLAKKIIKLLKKGRLPLTPS